MSTSASSNNKSMVVLLPVLFGFFIMGFVDFVGTAVNNAKDIFPVEGPKYAAFLSSAVFLWFFVFSIPTAVLMTKIGRKNTVLISTSVTFVAMLLPFFVENFWVWFFAFSLIGIGNTIIQVALNPLVKNCVSGQMLASAMTFGQFVKALASLAGPNLAFIAINHLGGFKYAFLIFAILSLAGTIWLFLTPVPVGEDERKEGKGIGELFAGNLALLGDPKILIFFLGILFVVGVDVGMNMTSPAILKAKLGFDTAAAGIGTTLYFVGRTVGAFLGAIILAKFAKGTVFKICMIATFAALALLYVGEGKIALYVGIVAIGFFCANIFSIIFAFAIGHKPERTDEISGLMIMGVSGGAIFPVLMDLAAKGEELTPAIAATATSPAIAATYAWVPAGAILVLALCTAYLFFVSFVAKEKTA